LLDFAKPLQLQWGHHRLESIVASTLELLEMKFKEKQLNVVPAIAGNMPTLNTDKDKLRQALINLLLNAVDASSPGGKIEVKGRLHKGTTPGVEIQIADEGPGFGDVHLKDIFEPFFTTKSKGTGLGLSIVQQIAEALGGSLVAANRPTGGAVFKLFLPVK
jgi:signal transduction histidine kinase